MRKAAVVLALALPVTGCNGMPGSFEWSYGFDKIVPGQHQIMATEFAADGRPTSKFRGTVLTWPSHAVGAIVTSDGEACLQSAQSAKARNRSGGVDLGAPITTDLELKVWASQNINEAVARIQDKNDLATFADVALFHICMLAVNDAIDRSEASKLVSEVIKSVGEVAKARPSGGGTLGDALKPDGGTVNPKPGNSGGT